MKKNNKKMDIVFLLDKSGSMAGCEKDTINSYNNYILEELKNNVSITTILFNDKCETLHFRKNIKDVKPLTTRDYYTTGCTALYDAIGKTIEKFEGVNNKILFVITTDGLENSSIKYTRKEINKLISEHNKWEFLYIGADIDSYAEGNLIGINDDHIANYEKSSKGINNLFKSIKRFCLLFEEDEFDIDWKSDLK